MQVAMDLAHLGYIAFAADMFGARATAGTQAEAMALAAPFLSDPTRLRDRARAGLAVLRADPASDGGRLAAIGFCLGGKAALDLARAGEDLAGVVCCHGNLSAAQPVPSARIGASILVCTGDDDPFVPPEQISDFREEMRRAGADWQVHIYGRVAHSFTNREADRYGVEGARYDAAADRRAKASMHGFFEEIFCRR
jgi:dienelactone hydrolase